LRKEKQINFINIEEGVVENQAIFTLTDIAQSQEETEALEYCLNTLPEEQRVSINYFFYDDKSYADIVDLTGFGVTPRH